MAPRISSWALRKILKETLRRPDPAGLLYGLSDV